MTLPVLPATASRRPRPTRRSTRPTISPRRRSAGRGCADALCRRRSSCWSPTKTKQSWVDSPGAYDNGAGTAAVLEIARVLAPYESERTIGFLFCNEEHTPWTSVTAAQGHRKRGDNLVAVFNVDSVGGKPDEEIAAGHKTNVTLYTEPEGKVLADLMASVNESYAIGLRQSCHQRPHPGDDDGSFIRVGYARAVANLGSWPYADAGYHLESDVPERVDVENVQMAAQATLAAVLTLDRS